MSGQTIRKKSPEQVIAEVDALLKENPPKGLVTRRKSEVIVYKEEN